MMKKYRVNEVAKDLNVENKDVIEAKEDSHVNKERIPFLS